MKKIVFVGGHHGAGKSSVCARLVERNGFMLARQRHLVIDVGQSKGLQDWERIGPRHEDLVPDAVALLSRRLLASSSTVALVDCHFAIRSEKALRRGARIATESYIHDLDPVLVCALASRFATRFVLIETSTEITETRLRARLTQWDHKDYAIGEIMVQQEVERVFLSRLLTRAEFSFTDVSCVRNDGSLEKTVLDVERVCLGD